jgi:hypothetical protein
MRGLVAVSVGLSCVALGGRARAQSASPLAIARHYGCNEAPPAARVPDGHPVLPIVRTYDGCPEPATATFDTPRLPLIRAYESGSAQAVLSVTLLPTITVMMAVAAALVARTTDDDHGPIRVSSAPPPGATLVLPEIVIPSAR